MAFSSYQIERLIRRLRRWIAGPFPGRGHVPDPVRTTSGEGHGAAMDSRLQGGVREEATDEAFSSRRAGAGQGGGRKAIAETRRYEAVVEAERERRAAKVSWQSAARTPGTLLAAMLMPTPLLQMSTPRSCSPLATASARGRAMSG